MASFQLPVMGNPGFTTECYHQFRLSIILAEPACQNWAFSHLANLTYHPPLLSHGFPTIRLEEHIDSYRDILNESLLFRKGSWTDAVRDALRNRQYVIAYINWKYVKNSRHYGGQDLLHEALIYGFDDSTRLLYMMAFDTGQPGYGAFAMPYASFEAEVERVARDNSFSHRWFAFYGFPAVTVSVLDRESDSFDMRSLYFAFDRHVVPVNSGCEMYATGYGVPLMLSRYFAEAGAGLRTIPQSEYGFWGIMTHKQREHNAFALLRLARLEQRYPRLTPQIKTYYQNSKLALARIGQLSYQYQRNRDARLLQKIADQYNKVYVAEKRAQSFFKQFLVEMQLQHVTRGGN